MIRVNYIVHIAKLFVESTPNSNGSNNFLQEELAMQKTWKSNGYTNAQSYLGKGEQ